jgi:predicted ATP-dependent endonuclease of OLD family
MGGDINLHLPQLKSSAAMLVVQQVKIFGHKLSNLHLLYGMITLAAIFSMTLEHWKHPMLLIENILYKHWKHCSVWYL